MGRADGCGCMAPRGWARLKAARQPPVPESPPPVEALTA